MNQSERLKLSEIKNVIKNTHTDRCKIFINDLPFNTETEMPEKKNVLLSQCVDFNVTSRKLLNRLTPRVKPWMIQSFLTFDSMDTTVKCDHSLESC